jgi:hypothetical protein
MGMVVKYLASGEILALSLKSFLDHFSRIGVKDAGIVGNEYARDGLRRFRVQLKFLASHHATTKFRVFKKID